MRARHGLLKDGLSSWSGLQDEYEIHDDSHGPGPRTQDDMAQSEGRGGIWGRCGVNDYARTRNIDVPVMLGRGRVPLCSDGS